MNRNYSSRQRPFGAIPDTRFYFPHHSIQSALDTTVRAITRAEGPVVALGGTGYGKSLLAELVCEALCDRLDIVKLQSARICSRQALLQNILYELQLPYRGLSEGELRLSILDRLEPSPETAPEGILLVIDEAHTLHAKLLDELRLLTNFSRNNQGRVRLLMLGNMRFEETLASPLLESLNQRLAARCYLQPMNREETVEYVRHQLRISGRNPESSITEDALRAVFSASDGIPRLVNQLMDHTLMMASKRASSLVSSDLVNESWAELQQLPTPWTAGKTEDALVSQGNAIEFGELDESPDEAEFSQTSGNYFSAFSEESELDVSNYSTVEAKECEQPGFECDSVAEEECQPAVAVPTAYDAMGLWENDPPLQAVTQSNFGAVAPSNLESRVDPESEDRTEELFGTDFDLEEVVPSQKVPKIESSGPDSSARKWSEDLSVVGDNYLVRLQLAADTLGQIQQFDSDVQADTAAVEPLSADSDLNAIDPHWSISVCANASAESPEESIERLVSQLNFSAFLIEPFSVEQIPLRATKNEGGSPEVAERLSDLPDGIRINEHQQVVMLHRPLENASYFDSSDDYDDDRDLLIIEEQVGPNSQMLLQSLPSEPAQKPSPYNQLFSRLRR